VRISIDTIILLHVIGNKGIF